MRFLSFTLSLFLVFASVPSNAAVVALTSMAPANALGGSELWYCQQSSTDRKCTTAQIDDYINSVFSGDCTVATGGAVTCTKTNGVAFGTFATASSIELTSNVTGILPIANGGSGSSSPSLTGGANINITGTWPSQTIASFNTNTVYATEYTGADSAVQVNNCLTGAPANGTCDATGITGIKNVGTTITIPSGKTLIFGNIQLISTATPAIALNSYTRLLGDQLSRIYTGTVGIDNASSGVSPANDIEISRIGVYTQAINTIGVNLHYMSSVVLNQITVSSNTLTRQSGTVGIQLDGANNCSCFNLITDPQISYMDKAYYLTGSANSNQVVGGETSHSNIGMEFFNVDGNSVFGTDFEGNYTNDVQFDAGSVGNSLVGTRMEEVNSITGITTEILNNATRINSVLSNFNSVTGVASYTDNTGTLKYTSNYVNNNKPQYFTIAQTLAITCNSASDGNTVYVKDTVGSATPTYHLVVAGGGASTVNSYAYCDGTAGSWKYN